MEDFDFDFENAVLAVDSHHGIYQPKFFVEHYRQFITGVDEDTLSELANPDNEHYWEAWETVVDNCTVTIDGNQYSIYQDNDVWLVPIK